MKILECGGKVNNEKHTLRGKLLVRDRIDRIIDKGTPFLELSQLAGFEMYDGEDVPAGAIITGIGVING